MQLLKGGIVLCHDADRPYVEYCVRNYDSPMGVATFKSMDEMPEKYRKALPNLEDMRKLLTDKDC